MPTERNIFQMNIQIEYCPAVYAVRSESLDAATDTRNMRSIPSNSSNGGFAVMEYESVITESAARQIAENIREAIMNGRLKVDERLPTEEELATRFKVSKPTIREALKRLAAQNLIR